MTTAADLLAGLACGRSGCLCAAAVRRGHGQTHCPGPGHAHQDGKPSLGVAEKGGKTVFNCRVGCSQDEVIAGLKERQLWANSVPARNYSAPNSRPAKVATTTNFNIKALDGEVWAIHRRVDFVDRSKDFTWHRPNGETGLNGLPATDLPLFRTELLSQLVAKAPVVIVEGEKAAVALANCLDGRNVGVLATLGSGVTPSDAVLACLADRRVVLWPDNDEAGRTHMAKVSAGLQRAGAADVRFVEWLGASPRGDAADFVVGRTREQALELLKAATAKWPPGGPFGDEAQSGSGSRFGKDELDQLVPVAGDFLNAERFLVAYGADIRWVPELKTYFVWNGSRWEEDRTDRAPAAAQETISQLRPWAAEEGIAESETKRRFSHYLASAKGGRAEALLAVARTRIAVGTKDLDQHPYLLAAKGATVDLRTGESKDPDRADLITRGSDHPYRPDAEGETWTEVLETTFGGDQELIGYFQRLMGYAATGVVAEHICPVFYGRGGNGRSTILGAVSDVLGELAMVAPDGLFIAQSHPQHPERIASLR
ncbi:MAG: toprim domain-containing protein, partial [Candidatus Dormibacteria bacterium]